MHDHVEPPVPTMQAEVELPSALFAEIAELERLLRDWLLGYTSRATRMSYADERVF